MAPLFSAADTVGCLATARALVDALQNHGDELGAIARINDILGKLESLILEMVRAPKASQEITQPILVEDICVPATISEYSGKNYWKLSQRDSSFRKDLHAISLTHSFERIQATCTDLRNLSDAAYEHLGRPPNFVRPRMTFVFAKAIKWVICARRPLSSDEFLEAVTADESCIQKYSSMPRLHSETECLISMAAVIDDCWGCLTVDNDDIVRIKSQAIQQLLERLIFHHPSSCTQRWMFDEEIAKVCLSNMSFQEPGFREQEIPRLRQGKLWLYSFEYWHEHCRGAEARSQDIPRLLHDRLQEDFCRAHKHESQICGQISSEDLIAALHFSIKYRLKVLAKTYLEMGADPNARMAPLFVTALHLAAKNEAPDLVQLLLRRGAEVDMKDALERSPLHYAAEAGSAEVIKLLLENGADLSPKALSAWAFEQTSYGNFYDDLNWEGFMLVDRYQSFDLSDDPKNVLSTSQEASDIWMARVSYLRQETSAKVKSYGRYVNPLLGYLRLGVPQRCVKGRSTGPELKMAILTSGVTPLHLAVCANKLQAVNALFKAGADVNVRTTLEDMTTLDIAIMMGHNQITEYLKSRSVHVAEKTFRLFSCASPRQKNEQLRIEPHVDAKPDSLGSLCSRLPKELEVTDIQETPSSDCSERIFSWLCHNNLQMQSECPTVACQQCSRLFQGKQRASSLKRHLNSVHGEAKFFCDVGGCPKTFTRQDKLRDHVRNQHRTC